MLYDPELAVGSHLERALMLVGSERLVAQEVLTQKGWRLARDTIGTPEALRSELVQVAAVAVGWIEALL